MRHHRAAARLLTLLPLVALLAGCESSGESRTVQMSERPRWTAGDSWTYRGKGRDGAYTITRRVLREGVFEGHDAYEVEAGDSRYWYTKRLGYLARVTGDRTVRRAMPPEDWQWPLQVGRSWSATVTWVDGPAQDQRFVQRHREGLGQGAGHRYRHGRLRGRADRLLPALTPPRGQRFWYSGRQRSRRASTCLIPRAITIPITPSTKRATIMSAAFRVPRDWMIR